MLSPTFNTHKLFFLSIPFKPFPSSTPFKPTRISAMLIPASTPLPTNQQLYQPFRPPPSPLPSQYRSLDAPSRLEILSNRLGLWYEYATIIPSLIQEGFTSPTIEEATGISGVEQNRLVVAAQVRDSLLESNTDPDIVSAFDTGGAELLYEIRLLSAKERADAARFIIENKFDAKGAQDLARSIKDYPRRRGERSWESFEYPRPGDCLSYMYYRQAGEHKNPSPERTNALEMALQVAESEKAKGAVLRELEGDREGAGRGEEVEDGVRVPVVRMMVGEVAEATSVVVLPVCRAEEREREVLEAPLECKSEGDFGVVVSEKGWQRWVVLPSWQPIAGLKNGGVAVAFPDARALPWRANRWYREEAVLVVADRGRKVVSADDGFYLVAHEDSAYGLKVERGSALKERNVEESLGTVLLVVRPPREDNDQLSDEEWD
ncbi:hypothetical protein Tsubulata_021278 [Turnera subulata]|uniref:Rubisco accumulation factor 1 C-terminal domain-containing protein n=1 Tax=Turnera subulata TaxID=218843 RepID=A0A9Q0FSV6_9ROSI|nr:hypothetical protein Tsubulata_021278 [Turnera subulata]